MIRITLVRHGETFQNRHAMVQGQDPTQGRLTERGMHQARLLGRALAGEHYDVVHCSPLERAVLTMSLVLVERPGDRTLPIRFADSLREIHLGELQGAPHTAWKASIHGDPMTFRPPGGESWLDVQERATRYLREVVLADGDREILMVAHGGVNRGLIASLTGISMGQSWQGPGEGAPQDNTCINRLVLDEEGQLIDAEINDTTHLAGADAEEGLRPRQRWVAAERRWQVIGGVPDEMGGPGFFAAP